MLDGKISISRPQGSGVDYISIHINDNNSNSQFLDIQIKYADFTEALTGLAGIPIKFTLRNAENVGKYIQRESLVIEIDKYHLNQNEADIIINDRTPEGWYASHYIGSRDNFFIKDNKYYLRTYIYRYVDKEPTEKEK